MSEVFTTSRLRSEPLAVLLPLRAFLGFVFLYAGLSKIADRTFLDDSSPLSMHASVVSVKSHSPIGSLLGPVVDHSVAFGLLMALGEIAVGIGTLAGLLHRIAAVGGVVLSLSLFLTVSWGADPWYTGADLGYAVAFVPLLLAGATPWSADAWLTAATRRRAQGGEDPRLVAGEDRTRRGILAGVAAAVGLLAVGGAALARGRTKPTADATASEPTTPAGAGSSPTPSTAQPARHSATATTAAPASRSASTSNTGSTPAATGKTLVKAVDVPVGGAKEVDDPVTGAKVWVLQLEAGKYTALSARCPHQGCAVDFVSKSTGFVCPCHRSAFSSTGVVRQGPANTNLTPVRVRESAGNITLS